MKPSSGSIGENSHGGDGFYGVRGFLQKKQLLQNFMLFLLASLPIAARAAAAAAAAGGRPATTD